MIAGRVVAGRQDGWICGWRPTQFEVLSGTDDELLHVGRIVPIYHETKGWTSRQMRILNAGTEHGAPVGGSAAPIGAGAASVASDR